MEVLLILLKYAIFIVSIRVLTVVFHELGHAIPAMILSKQPVSVYIGSYGDTTKSKNITVGLLDVWFTPNPLTWQTGLCVPSAKEISINRQIIYTLTGPLASFTIAAVAFYFSFFYSLDDSIKTFLFLFLVSSFFDLTSNLSPRDTPIALAHGGVTYNDGHALRELLAHRKFPKGWATAAELFSAKKYEEAAQAFHAFIKNGIKHEDIYRAAIASYMESKSYVAAKLLSEEFWATDKMTSNDYATAALAYSKCDEHTRSLELYDKSLELDPNNKYALNNKGYTLNLLSRFEEAIPLFDKAIELDHAMPYAYNNRGLAKIKTGREQEGLAEIHHSFELDGTNSYCYLNLGIYHLDKGENVKALEFFNKAKAMDSTTLHVDEYIGKAEVSLRGK